MYKTEKMLFIVVFNIIVTSWHTKILVEKKEINVE